MKLGVNVDPACEYPYTANNESVFLKKSVGDLQGEDLAAAFPRGCVRLLAGCAPCQTFSTYNQKASADDERWHLLRHFARLVLELEPELVTIENVPGLEGQRVFRSFVKALTKLDFRIEHTVVNCADYGIPQRRHRLVLLASRLGPIRLLTPKAFKTHRHSVRDAIGHLPPIRAGEVCDTDRMHQSSALFVRQPRADSRVERPAGPGATGKRALLQAATRRALAGRTRASTGGWIGTVRLQP